MWFGRSGGAALACASWGWAGVRRWRGSSALLQFDRPDGDHARPERPELPEGPGGEVQDPGPAPEGATVEDPDEDVRAAVADGDHRTAGEGSAGRVHPTKGDAAGADGAGLVVPRGQAGLKRQGLVKVLHPPPVPQDVGELAPLVAAGVGVVP